MATPKPRLSASGVTKTFGGVAALCDFSCDVAEGEILGLVGPNGAGKTTFLNVVSGFVPPDRGSVVFQGEPLDGVAPHHRARLGIFRTFQNVRLIRGMSVLDNLLLFFRDGDGEGIVEPLVRWRRLNSRERERSERAMSLLHRVGLAEKASDAAGTLSYGQQKLVNLAGALANDATLLLLDEPAAGIAPKMVERIMALLHDMRGENKSIVVIEHDFAVIDALCDRVIFMAAGSFVTEGTPAQVRVDERVVRAYLG